MSTDTIITVWIPALNRGAPSNASGVRGAYTPYATRAAALAHDHWANHAPWATARSVLITDTPSGLMGDADLVCDDLLRWGEQIGEFDPVSERAAKLIREGARVDGVRYWLEHAGAGPDAAELA